MESVGESHHKSELSVLRILGFGVRYWRQLLFLPLIGLTVGFTWAVVQAPTFRATAAVDAPGLYEAIVTSDSVLEAAGLEKGGASQDEQRLDVVRRDSLLRLTVTGSDQRETVTTLDSLLDLSLHRYASDPAPTSSTAPDDSGVSEELDRFPHLDSLAPALDSIEDTIDTFLSSRPDITYDSVPRSPEGFWSSQTPAGPQVEDRYRLTHLLSRLDQERSAVREQLRAQIRSGQLAPEATARRRDSVRDSMLTWLGNHPAAALSAPEQFHYESLRWRHQLWQELLPTWADRSAGRPPAEVVAGPSAERVDPKIPRTTVAGGLLGAIFGLCWAVSLEAVRRGRRDSSREFEELVRALNRLPRPLRRLLAWLLGLDT